MPDDSRSPMRKFLGSFTAGAAIAAFTVSPLLRYADPVDLWIAGIAVAGTIVINIVSEEQTRGLLGRVVIQALGVGGIVFAVWWARDWTSASSANDRRCLAIQRDMLSAHPRRTDGPDLFQALGCRPQGEGSVYAPARGRQTPSVGPK